MADSSGMADLRLIDYERAVTGFALQNFVVKELVAKISTTAWQNNFQQETATELTAATSTGATTLSIKGIGRMSDLPFVAATWTEKQAFIDKYGCKTIIAFEDIKFNKIDVIARNLVRLGRAVANAVDTQIWNIISENQSASTINTQATTAAWDAGSGQKPMLDILRAVQAIWGYNYSLVNNGFLLMSPYDYASLLAYIWSVGSTAPEMGSQIGFNGQVPRIAGLQAYVSPVVTADYALVGKKFECANWYIGDALTAWTEEKKKISITVSATELGVTALTNPRALCIVTNTKT